MKEKKEIDTALPHVAFVGAGPGDPELLTIKGQKAIARAGMVLYAGSLVPPDVISCASKEARIYDSSGMTLEEAHALVAQAVSGGEHVARVHTGDPSLYSALPEQIALLERDGIPWLVIPGITAACAAAAAAGISFTMPEISQSLIITRQPGRTPMPALENIASLAAHHAAMAVYLSGKTANALQKELEQSLDPETPVLCAQRVGWPEQKLVWATVGGLASCVKNNSLERQTVFLVLPGNKKEAVRSRLYSCDFSHDFRSARSNDR